MTRRLVADVGGTNTRLGLAENGNLITPTIRSYRNDDFPDFWHVAQTFLSQIEAPDFRDVVIAIAGPTTGAAGRLTNRDWQFEAGALAAKAGDKPVTLLNDLRALGFAVGQLRPSQIETFGAAADRANGQSLVVGIGTGFNVCPVNATDAGVVCAEAEYGHGMLPWAIREMLQSIPGVDVTSQFATVEDVFSGRGYRTLERLFADCSPSLGRGREFRRFYLGLLARLVGDLSLAFLPWNGIYFAGGVSRAVLDPDGYEDFLTLMARDRARMFDISCPMHLITDDHAALYGCARV